MLSLLETLPGFRRLLTSAQIGIELSPGVCRIIEVDVRRQRSGMGSIRVRRFSVVPHGSVELMKALETLDGRPASVVVWGAPGDHRQVMVTAGTYVSMRREARRALSLAGVETRGALIDISRAPSPDSGMRRSVVVALANGAAVRAAVQPLLSAGIDIRTLATPATALVSLARTLRRLRPENPAAEAVVPAETSEASVRVDAYVAIEESGTCITLLRDGVLVAARELSWGFQTGRRGEPRRREEVASRLVDEFAEFMIAVGGSTRSVRRATLCGGAPHLRSVAAILSSQFHIETEVLEAPPGLEGEPDAAARERSAGMSMAWAVAVDRRAPLSLVHSQRRDAVQARVARAAIAAGVVAGVAAGYQVARPLLRAEPSTQPHVARQAPAPSSSSQLVSREND